MVNKSMKGHHLILGKLEDFLTGETLDDTHDERYRQRLAHLLMEDKGYHRNEVHSRLRLTVKADDKKASVPVDFMVRIADQIHMIIKYGPGSLVTRHRPALAASRLLTPVQVPVVVVTNGVDAHILDGASGQVVASGIDSIPTRRQLLDYKKQKRSTPISAKQAELESRIVYCYEVDGSCPCDETVCKL